MDTSEFDILVEKLQYAKETYEMAKKMKTEAHSDLEEKKHQILTALKDTGKSKYHVKGLGTVYTITKYQVTTPKGLEDKRLFFGWLKERFGDDVSDSMLGVNHQTLNSFMKKEFEAAEERGDVAFTVPGLEDPAMIESVGFRGDK